MKLLRFRYILSVFIVTLSALLFVAYSAILFDTDSSTIWYGPLHISGSINYTDNQASVTTDNNLDGGPIICPQVSCGDGIINGSDICDKADLSHTHWWINWCNNSCIPINGAVCGDGITTQPEFCDDGVDNNHPGFCNEFCTARLPKCWNTLQEDYPLDTSKNEACDKWPLWGNIDLTHFCSHSCKIKVIGTWPGGGTINCWDDEIDPGEICDEWSTNGTWPGHCLSDCSDIEPIPCVGCSCDNSCPVTPITPGPVINPPTPPTTGNSSDSFGS